MLCQYKDSHFGDFTLNLVSTGWVTPDWAIQHAQSSASIDNLDVYIAIPNALGFKYSHYSNKILTTLDSLGVKTMKDLYELDASRLISSKGFGEGAFRALARTVRRLGGSLHVKYDSNNEFLGRARSLIFDSNREVDVDG